MLIRIALKLNINSLIKIYHRSEYLKAVSQRTVAILIFLLARSKILLAASTLAPAEYPT